MTKKTKEQLALEALEAYMAGLNEKKLKVSDNQLIAARQRSLDPEWYKANSKRLEDPNYVIRQSQVQKTRIANLSEEERIEISIRAKKNWQNEEYVNRMRAFYSTPEYKEYITKRNKEIANRPEIKQKISKLNKDKRLDPAHIKKHQEAVNKRTQNPEWRKKQTERSKPMVTPDGIFKSRKDAAEFYQVKTPVMNSRMNRYPDQYYYISQEEYFMLTGKDI
jgi:hypothetical protein